MTGFFKNFFEKIRPVPSRIPSRGIIPSLPRDHTITAQRGQFPIGHGVIPVCPSPKRLGGPQRASDTLTRRSEGLRWPQRLSGGLRGPQGTSEVPHKTRHHASSKPSKPPPICSKILISLVFYESVTNGRTDGPTDGQTDPLIEMRGRI